MVDTIRTLGALQLLLPDNQTFNISPQDLRDFLVSVYTGYAAYDDQASKDTPIAGTGGVPLLITIDTLGSNTRETRLPYGIVGPNALWDIGNSRADLSQLSTDDLITFRLDFEITTVGSNAELDILVDIYDDTPTLLNTLTINLPDIPFASTKNVFRSLPIFKDGIVDALGFRILCSNNFTVSFGTLFMRVDR
jgi:hypothetical protein